MGKSRIDFEACEGMDSEARNRAYERFSTRSDFEATLLRELGGSAHAQGIVSWFLKKHLEQGAAFSVAHVSQIYSAAARVEDWEAMLHVLQCISHLGIPKASRKTVEALVRRSLEHDNKFVRAWAYNGFNELAASFPGYQEEALALFKDAMQHEAASVKARVRNLSKSYGE